MAKTERSSTPCPKPERLLQLITHIEMSLEESDNQLYPEIVKADKETIEALQWLYNHLTSRTLYHKKLQFKRKILLQLGKEHGLLEEADKLAGEALFNHVASELPDEDELTEIKGDAQ